MPIQINKIGEIYREIIDEANRRFKIALIGRKGTGKSEVGAWLFMGNPYVEMGDLDMVDIYEIVSLQEKITALLAKMVQSDMIIFVVDATKKASKAELAVWRGLRQLGKPVLLVANKIDLVPSDMDNQLMLRTQFGIGQREYVEISAKEGINIEKGLIPKVASLAKDIETPMARRFPILRAAVANRVIQRTAAENTVIGTLVFLPGADTPIMTANQVRMVMKLAIVYGQDLGLERLKELVAVLGGAMLFRTVARQAVAYIPVFGWAIKGGIAYGGTIALGKAAIKYFEKTEELAGEQVDVDPDSLRLIEISKTKHKEIETGKS